jgi:hypothetical protein
MNLQQFIEYKKYCPVCHSELTTHFHSNRRQSVRYEYGRAIFLFDSDGISVRSKQKTQVPAKLGYSFDLNSGDFNIEFYDKNIICYRDKVTCTSIGVFRELHSNLKVFKFSRSCRKCQHYAYHSQNFNIDLKVTCLEPLDIWSEEVGLSFPLEEGFRIYYLLNVYGEDRSFLNIIKAAGDWGGRLLGGAYGEGTQLPIIPITSQQEMIQRFNNLIAFL